MAHHHRLLTSLALTVIGLAAGNPLAQGQDTATNPLPKRLVGDYGYWSRTQTPPYSSDQIPFKKLTHINHAGVSFGADGALVIPDGFLEPKLIEKAHEARVKVLLLLGGDFNTLVTTPALVNTLVDNLRKFIVGHAYDGVDVDWEYPATTADRTTFHELMTELREAFRSPQYVISADVPPWGGDGYDFAGVAPVVDYFNIMMYDCAGPWTDDGQLNSAIFPDPKNPEPYLCEPGGSVKEAAEIFLNQLHIPAVKLNMGTPFYGYFYTNVNALWGVCNPCDDTTVLYEPYGTFVKQRINRQGWKTFYDSVSSCRTC